MRVARMTRMMGQRQRMTGARRRGVGAGPIAAAALTLALIGCQEPITGIFHHLAAQKPPIDRNLPNDLTIGGVVRWGDRYVVAAGKMWSRAVGTAEALDTWTSMTLTYDGESANAVLLPLVRWRPDGGEPSLLAGAVFVDDDSFALLRAADVKAGSIAWRSVRDARVRDAAENGREVVGLFTPDADESVLFAVVAGKRGANATYTLLSAAGPTSGDPGFDVELAELPYPITAIAADGEGAYWAVAGADLYTGSRGSLSKSATPPVPSGAEQFRGALYAPPDRLLVSGSAGALWRSSDRGATWDEPLTITVADQAEVPLAGMAAVGATVLIGTDGFGYFTSVLNDGALSANRLPITTEAIYRSSISGFRVDRDTGGPATVFAITTRDGMWTATVSPGELPGRWQLE